VNARFADELVSEFGIPRGGLAEVLERWKESYGRAVLRERGSAWSETKRPSSMNSTGRSDACGLCCWSWSRSSPENWRALAPQTRRVVPRRGRHALAIGAEYRAPHVILMAFQDGDLNSRLGIPLTRRVVFRRGRHSAAIGAERRACHPLLMAPQDGDLGSRLGVPQTRRFV